MTGSDYVFDSTYHLPSIDSLRDFIKEHHHLPEIPLAQELKNFGVDIGENAKIAIIENRRVHLVFDRKR